MRIITMNRKRLARSSLVKPESASSRTRPRATTLASVVSISRPPFAQAPRRDLRLPGRCRRFGISGRGSYGPGRGGFSPHPYVLIPTRFYIRYPMPQGRVYDRPAETEGLLGQGGV